MKWHDSSGNISPRTALIGAVLIVVGIWYYNKPKGPSYGPVFAPPGA